MNEAITREKVLEKLKTVEHPEIAVSLVDLGMILDVAVEGNTAKLALAFPMANIPQVVVDAVVNSTASILKEFGLEMQTDFFEMTPEARENFFIQARANWKGSM